MKHGNDASIYDDDDDDDDDNDDADIRSHWEPMTLVCVNELGNHCFR